MQIRSFAILLALVSGLCVTSAGAAELAAVLEAQPEAVKARYAARHPQETLSFFGIEPGMTVVEALPGGGWYSKILIAALGSKGRLIGADYPYAMYPMFNFYSDEYLEEKKTWTDSWAAQARDWVKTGGAQVDAVLFGSMPESLTEQVDAVLFIRALHNFARFEADGGYLSAALKEAHRVLKSGGIVGVVQHRAPDDASNDWANGSNGYLKQSFVVERLTEAGFEFVGSSDVNLNPADKPTDEDFVWRLPPSLATSKDNPDLAAKYKAIGESSRMTLLFKKP